MRGWAHTLKSLSGGAHDPRQHVGACGGDFVRVCREGDRGDLLFTRYIKLVYKSLSYD
jgi:hypothetical protein